MARPMVRWAVADDFFRLERIEALIAEHDKGGFQQDDVGLNYDSLAVRLDSGAETGAMALLGSPSWQRYARLVAGTRLAQSRTVVKFRRHPPNSLGFWPHTDRDGAKALAVLGYFNRDWQAGDGGLLQLWDVRTARDPQARPWRWADFIGRRIDFIENSRAILVEAAGETGPEIVDAFLLDQIVPNFNRVVFLNLEHSPAFHSVTPTYARPRNGFLQWMY
jgi:hypothetical protein